MRRRLPKKKRRRTLEERLAVTAVGGKGIYNEEFEGRERFLLAGLHCCSPNSGGPWILPISIELKAKIILLEGKKTNGSSTLSKYLPSYSFNHVIIYRCGQNQR